MQPIGFRITRILTDSDIPKNLPGTAPGVLDYHPDTGP